MVFISPVAAEVVTDGGVEISAGDERVAVSKIEQAGSWSCTPMRLEDFGIGLGKEGERNDVLQILLALGAISQVH